MTPPFLGGDSAFIGGAVVELQEVPAERYLVARRRQLSQGYAPHSLSSDVQTTHLSLLPFTPVFLPDQDPDLAAFGLALVALRWSLLTGR